MRTSMLASLAAILVVTLQVSCVDAAEKPKAKAPTSAPSEPNMSEYVRPSEAELKKKLSPTQFEVVCNEATEPPFQNAYWNNHEAGLYVDIVSGEPLFSSTDKFDSGTGWPSFTQPVDNNNVVEKTDSKLGMRRTEVRSAHGDSHLGHVFNDGPAPEGLRYCINSASLRFIAVKDLEKEGYGKYLAVFGEKPKGVVQRETATLAGGCFWGMEDLLRQIPGVIETRVGYTGGTQPNATYNDVKTGGTGHAESVEVVFDPSKVSYETLLENHFFKMHDPTSKDRQGNDVGTQYRSAIFYHSEAQKKAAEAAIAKVNKSGFWKKPLVTQVLPATPFYTAEDYHQDYLQKNPNGYTCHFVRQEPQK